MSIQKMSVERNEYGFWTHPEVLQLIDKHRTHDLYFNEFQIAPFLKCAVGCDIETVSMCDLDTSKLISCCVESKKNDCSQWEPEPPTESSFLLSIHDTDCGPVAWFAVPDGKQAIECSEVEQLRKDLAIAKGALSQIDSCGVVAGKAMKRYAKEALAKLNAKE